MTETTHIKEESRIEIDSKVNETVHRAMVLLAKRLESKQITLDEYDKKSESVLNARQFEVKKSLIRLIK